MLAKKGKRVYDVFMFSVWLYYPMPFRDELDKSLRDFDGWYGSGVTLVGDEMRDNSIEASYSELAAILALLPDDGKVEITRT